jgi:hypothetical protein
MVDPADPFKPMGEQLQKEYADNFAHMQAYKSMLQDKGIVVASDDPREIAKELCRNVFGNKLFVSHTGDDANWCIDTILPVIEKRFGKHSYFFMSLATDAQEANIYRVLVEYSFYWAKTIIIALSAKSLTSHWVKLEAKWAVEQRHPIIICFMDESRPAQLHPGFSEEGQSSQGMRALRFIDFRLDLTDAQKLLDELLQAEEFAPLFTGDELRMNLTAAYRYARRASLPEN